MGNIILHSTWNIYREHAWWNVASILISIVKEAVERKIFNLIFILFGSTFQIRKNGVFTKSIFSSCFRDIQVFVTCKWDALWRHLLNHEQINMMTISSNNCAHCNVLFVSAKFQNMMNISSNNCAHCNVLFVFAKFQFNLNMNYSGIYFSVTIRYDVIRYLVCIFKVPMKPKSLIKV